MKITFTENPYPYKHWLTSVVLGPLFATIYSYVTIPERKIGGSLDGVAVYSMMGLMFSLPVFILYLIIFNLLFKTGTSPFILKIALNLLAIFGVIITFKVVFGEKGMSTAFFYIIAILVSSLFYPIKKTATTDE